MSEGQTRVNKDIPKLWLLSDERNDAVMEESVAALPIGSGVVFRHYHLSDDAREARFRRLSGLATELGHLVALSGSPEQAQRWGATAVYGPPARLGKNRSLIRIATVHGAEEIEQANSIAADAAMLSPVFATRSHPDGDVLGRDRFLALAALADMPVIALGGMTEARASELGWPRWAAIDGLSTLNP